MMDYEQAMASATKALSFEPTSYMMLHACMSKEIDTRKTFNKVKLGIEDKTMEYYGGMPSDGKSRIPEGSAYSRLKQTSMPTLSQNILKCRDEVKVVMEEFWLREILFRI